MNMLNRTDKCLLIICLIVLSATASAQTRDRLIWQGDTLWTNSNELLESHPNYPEIELKLRGPDEKEFPFGCQRGYFAEWRVVDDELFLTNIYDPKSNKVSLKKLFGKSCNNNKVKADWITTELIFPRGEIVLFIDDFSSIFEKELGLSFEKGSLINHQIFDNSKTHVSRYHNNWELLEKDINLRINWDKIPPLGSDTVRVYLSITSGESPSPDSVILIRGDKNEVFNSAAVKAVRSLPDWNVIYRKGKVAPLFQGIPVSFHEEKRLNKGLH